MLGSNIIKFFSRILKRRVDSSTNFVSFFSFMKYYSSVLFLAQTIYTLLKRSPLKWKFLNFVSHFSFIKDNSSILFLAFLTIYTLPKRSPLKWKFWRVTSAQVKICKISYLHLKQQVHSSPNFVCVFSFMKDYFYILF